MQKVTKLPEWEQQWQHAKQFIEPAVKHQKEYTIDDIEDKIRCGLFHLWTGKQSAFVTEIVIFPQLNAMNLLFCGGDYKELEEMLASIEIFAKNAGITRIHAGGRKGWKRKLKNLGFKEEHIITNEL